MSSHVKDASLVPALSHGHEKKESMWQGVLIGLIPLGLLLVTLAISIFLTMLMRLVFASAGFFAQQQAAVIMLITGLLLTIIVFAIASWRVLRQVALWQQAGLRRQASVALWALSGTALFIVAPILVASLLPQHPFP